MWRAWFYPLLIILGFAVYFGIDYLPPKWVKWLKGKKTHLVGWAAIVGPEVVDSLMQAQSLGIHEYLGPQWAKIFTQVVGVMAIVTRLRTNKEKT